MGAICPKGKHSSARRDKRRASSWRIKMANLAACNTCSALVPTHRVCKECGSYNKREVVKVAE